MTAKISYNHDRANIVFSNEMWHAIGSPDHVRTTYLGMDDAFIKLTPNGPHAVHQYGKSDNATCRIIHPADINLGQDFGMEEVVGFVRDGSIYLGKPDMSTPVKLRSKKAKKEEEDDKLREFLDDVGTGDLIEALNRRRNSLADEHGIDLEFILGATGELKAKGTINYG